MLSGAHAEDAALVKRLLDGDEAAFAGLVDQYHGRLLRLAMMFVSERASAEEVVQDTWLAVLTGLRS
ncbi:MAG: RNA polymerase sigma factor, partial [Acidobacteria bacterium]|nr:RNA polymerase sigma factor [Acidobacteriota bacterium]